MVFEGGMHAKCPSVAIDADNDGWLDEFDSQASRQVDSCKQIHICLPCTCKRASDIIFSLILKEKRQLFLEISTVRSADDQPLLRATAFIDFYGIRHMAHLSSSVHVFAAQVTIRNSSEI